MPIVIVVLDITSLEIGLAAGADAGLYPDQWRVFKIIRGGSPLWTKSG
jgi:hypothetical protein